MADCTCTTYGRCVVCQPQREAEWARTFPSSGPSTAAVKAVDDRHAASAAGGPVRPTPTTLVDRSSNPGRGGATPFHAAPHPQAGKAVLVDLDGGDLVTFYVEDWWDRVAGGSWMMAQGNPAAIKYFIRARRRGLPIDDEVVYGEINGFGVLVHDSEIRAVAHA